MQNKMSKTLYFIICFAFFTFITLHFSSMIVNNISNGGAYSNCIFSLDYVENTGAAFSLLENFQEVIIIGSVVAICWIFSFIVRNISNISMMSIFFLSLLSAGIGGNLHERIAYGFVRDFIQLNFINFPVFNISDIFINIGVLAIIVIIIFKNKL